MKIKAISISVIVILMLFALSILPIKHYCLDLEDRDDWRCTKTENYYCIRYELKSTQGF